MRKMQQSWIPMPPSRRLYQVRDPMMEYRSQHPPNRLSHPSVLTREAREETTDLTREVNGNIRVLEDEDRKFEISFSSEEPYNRGYVEILDHDPGAVDLTRLNEIGVMLFNHERDEVIGRIERAWVEGNRGKAVVVFDNDEKSNRIYEKVRSGTLKGVSVGYRILNEEWVEAGSVSKSGKFQGPCVVATSWMPFEVSIVSVPADPTVGVGRDMAQPEANPRKQVPMAERQLQINVNHSLL